jgi:hypothetical protein
MATFGVAIVNSVAAGTFIMEADDDNTGANIDPTAWMVAAYGDHA